jgi:DNA polymerase I-like protein with 3'-5' exonuclease and polymerase domains
MLGEYILQRGQKLPLTLEACAKRYELDTLKQDTLKEYFKKGYSTRDIPHDELSTYLSADLHATYELFRKLEGKYNDKDSSLQSTIKLTNDIAVQLARIYQRGFKVDLKVLDEVRIEFEKEKLQLTNDLQKQVRFLMGDRPINLNSPEQLSWVVYSRKPIDKPMWANAFGSRINNQEFKSLVKAHSNVLYKQKATQCPVCRGTGKIQKKTKKGVNYVNASKCVECNSTGYMFQDNKQEVAGLKFVAPNINWISANGFGTGKENLTALEGVSRSRGMSDAVKFLQDVRRLSALDTYLSSFVEGIATYVKADGLLHVKLLQHRTGTGRLSGSEPNMQNMPRGNTFPVKKVFISRWEGGKIMEADFAQLEFRVAAYLSQDKTAIDEVSTGFDVHSYTAKVISDAGQKISRQEAKEHTFAPLYGASGFGRTPAEASYYQQFNKKYQGISRWHKELANEVLNTGKVSIPSGREFAWPDVTRKRNGGVTYFTQIKNYPVQAFATADIVPISLAYIDKMLAANNMQSCIVNTVHDSIVIDVHPTEEERVIKIINRTNDRLVHIINKKWGIDFNVPLLLEAKIGSNWLDTKDVA